MIRYQITQFGMGFEGRHPLGKRRVLAKLRRRIRKLDMPVTIEGDATGTRYNLEGVMRFARNHIDKLGAGDRLTFEGASYDQPKWVVRGIEVEPDAPMVNWANHWVGRSSYLLGGDGPPGPTDCSGFTAAAAKAVYGIILPHGADLQKHSPLIDIFYDASRVERDDFIFFNYGRLRWPQADHVEIVDVPGSVNIGSRPSTNGVNIYHLQAFDLDNILCYGRLKH